MRDAYLAQGEFAFVELDREFKAGTEAIVLRLQHVEPWSDRLFVAIIDARGPKAARTWFSKWHEIAHLLAEPQTSFVFRRTPSFRREPVERLMDQIAAALAFYEPLFAPSLRAHVNTSGAPTLRELRDFAVAQCSFASLQATMQAALRYCATPAILIEARPAVKVATTKRRGSKDERPALRAVTAAHNDAARRARMFIHRNMRVPTTSIIHRVFVGDAAAESIGARENLDWWATERRALSSWPVVVEVSERRAGTGSSPLRGRAIGRGRVS